MTEPVLPRSGWRDPRYLRTHRGLLLFRTRDGGFDQAEADVAPKNLVVARHPRRGWRAVHLHDSSAQVRPPDAIVASLSDAAQSTVIDDVAVEPLPGPDNFALRQSGLHLSEGKRGELRFTAARVLAWEVFEATTPNPLAYQLWRPESTMGGTQLMQRGLSERLGTELEAIDLHINRLDTARLDGRPAVAWLHNDANNYFRWCADPRRTGLVAAFVFVSEWQRRRFLSRYPAIPAERCHVIHNATDAGGPARPWPSEKPWRWRCAYTSAPNRGLSILLDAWERLDPADAELHIWSSFRLWGQRFTDTEHQKVFSHARRLPGVTYHGIRPNAEVRLALRDMHFLTYPATVDETFCLAALEALAAGVRVVATSRSALPEVTGGFAHLYAMQDDREAQVTACARALAEEFRNPWAGRPAMATVAQSYARANYGWQSCVASWRRLIKRLTSHEA